MSKPTILVNELAIYFSNFLRNFWLVFSTVLFPGANYVSVCYWVYWCLLQWLVGWDPPKTHTPRTSPKVPPWYDRATSTSHRTSSHWWTATHRTTTTTTAWSAIRLVMLGGYRRPKPFDVWKLLKYDIIIDVKNVHRCKLNKIGTTIWITTSCAGLLVAS